MSYNALCYAEKKPGRPVITVKNFYMLIIENEQDMHLCIRFLLRSQTNASLCLFRYAVKEHWQDSRNISNQYSFKHGTESKNKRSLDKTFQQLFE